MKQNWKNPFFVTNVKQSLKSICYFMLGNFANLKSIFCLIVRNIFKVHF